MTLEELVEELAELLYMSIVRPRRITFDELPAELRETWRAGARAAIRWLGEFPAARDGAPAIPIDELLR